MNKYQEALNKVANIHINEFDMVWNYLLDQNDNSIELLQELIDKFDKALKEDWTYYFKAQDMEKALELAIKDSKYNYSKEDYIRLARKEMGIIDE